MSQENIGQAIQDVYNKLSGLDADSRSKVIRAVLAAFGEAAPAAHTQTGGSAGGGAVNGETASSGNQGTGTPPTAKAWMASKKPNADVERVVCLGAYLIRFQSQASFNTKDLTKLNQDAHQLKIGNMAQAVSNATEVSQYLAPAGGGKKQLTVRGDAVVDALPDREKVKAALEEHPLKKRRAKKKAKGSAKA